ncbi:MAG TPA: DUF4215 domain-containing protein [Kofleriaceae bacterium]|jgi:cysteine-rich repeat protein
MERSSGYAVVIVLALTACIEPRLLPCGDLLCPVGTTCVANEICATPEDLVPCTGLADGDACMVGAQIGLCGRGLCALAACGDGVVDANELCDDGNQISGDGCRADCGKVEVCGDMVVDEGEPCDDGNTNPADGCDMCVKNAWSAVAIVGGTVNTAAQGLFSPQAVAVDRDGNVFICDSLNNRVRRVDKNGVMTTFAGTGVEGFSGDGGPAVNAQISQPSGIAVDDLGNVYFSDRGNNRIRRIGQNSIISTIAGNGSSTFGGDLGPALAAGIDPFGIAVDGLGNLYLADRGHGRIRRIDGATGIITTIAGTNSSSYNGDNIPAITANLFGPATIALSGDVLYIADTYHWRVRKIDASGTLTTVAGTGNYGDGLDGGVATSTDLNEPTGVTVDSHGTLYIADSENGRVRRLEANGTLTTIGGAGFPNGFDGDGGPATAAHLTSPHGLAVDASGTIYIADTANNRVRRIAGTTISTIAGTSLTGFGGDGGAATSAPLLGSGGIAFDPTGTLYVADSFASIVRRIDTMGVIATIAGAGIYGYAGDGGPAIVAQLRAPSDVAADGAGNVYIADNYNKVVRRVATDGTISTVVTGLQYPQGLDVDAMGNIYVADSNNSRVVKVDAGGTTTIIGAGTLNQPTSCAIDGNGNLFIADHSNGQIYRFDAMTSVLSIFVDAATLGGYPQAIDIDASGNLFVADDVYSRVLRVDTSGSVTTIAGAGVGADDGDGGPATSAILDYPHGIALHDGAIYVRDRYSIRRIGGTGQIVTVAGAIGPEGMGPAETGRLTDARALALTGPFPLVAGGLTGTLQAVREARVEVVAGRYPQPLAVGAQARFRAADFGTIDGVAYDPTLGLIYVTETSHQRLYAVTPVDPTDPNTWTIQLLANASGTAGFSDGAAAMAQFRTPSGLYLDDVGRKLYVADTGNHAIRAIDLGMGIAGATVTTIAGTPAQRGFSGDGGPATAAQLYEPHAITRCASGDLFIADTGNHRVRRIAAGTNTITTVLGDGVAASSGEGAPATGFPVNAPLGITCDDNGNVFVSSTTTVRMLLSDDSRHIDGTGAVQTIYGRSPRTEFPASVAGCLTGIATVDATRVQVVDSCTGILVELRRQ